MGTTVIDELRLCYITEYNKLTSFASLKYGEWLRIGDYIVFRTSCNHFEFGFDVFLGSHEDKQNVANLKFGRYGEQTDPEKAYVYYRIENQILYDTGIFLPTLLFPTDVLGFVFNNITAIDLARDYSRNITNKIRQMYKNESITTIINGKAVTDRKAILPTVSIVYATSLDRLRNPAIYIKQAKAVKNKSKGKTVCCYDKANEMENPS